MKETAATDKLIALRQNKIRELFKKEFKKIYQCPFLPGLENNLERMEKDAKKKLDGLMKHQTSNANVLKRQRGEENFRRPEYEVVQPKPKKPVVNSINEDSDDEAPNKKPRLSIKTEHQNFKSTDRSSFKGRSKSMLGTYSTIEIQEEQPRPHYQRQTWYGQGIFEE